MFHKLIFIPTMFILAAFLLGACEKVVQIDLNSSVPKTVIEASLQEGEHLFTVRVYQTKSYFSNKETVRFDDAEVSLYSESGETISLNSAGNGLYTAIVDAQAGKTYTLQVLHDGKSFIASSFLPEPVILNQVSSKELSLPGEENSREVYVEFDDKPGLANYHRIIVSSNDSLEHDLQYFDDKYTDGNRVKWALLNLYEPGDQLSVELRSIDAAAYEYYFTLAPVLEGNSNTAPGNPISNWEGGALGYFIAYSSSVANAVVE